MNFNKKSVSFSDKLYVFQSIVKELDTSGFSRKKESGARFIEFMEGSHGLSALLPEHTVKVWRDSATGYYAITISFSPSYSFDIIFANSSTPYYKTLRKSPTNGASDGIQERKTAGYTKTETVHNVLLRFVKQNGLDKREKVQKNA